MKIKLSSILLLIPFFAFAQNNEGTIVYTETMKLQIDIPDEHREQFKGMFPESTSSKKELLFSASESIYRDQKGQDKDEVIEAGSEESGMHMKMVMSRPDNQLYKNFEKQESYQKQDLFGRNFLVTSDIKDMKWKLINESKNILGFSCMKATYTKDDKLVTAWYSSEIPVNNGPSHYGQLPGMILELDVDDGQSHIVATEISLNNLADDAINPPKKGKKVSQEEYDKIAEEKEKEMEEEFGKGGGRMVIKQRGH